MRMASDTRQRILQTALKRFAEKGYAGTSVQDLAAAARVSKPVLYYYFRNKADLYGALVARAGDERLRLMREAVARADTLAGQLKELCAALFESARTHRELMRLAFATALAAPREAPREAHCFEKGWESFQFIEDLIERGRMSGVLDHRFDGRALALGFCGVMHLHVLLHLLQPEQPLDRQTAEAVVDLFLSGSLARRTGDTSEGALLPSGSVRSFPAAEPDDRVP